MQKLREIFGRLFSRDEEGQTLIEYVLILVVVVLAIITAYNSSEIKQEISEALFEIACHLDT
ncbi:MAG: hypothetical protein V3W31_02350 [Thermodesulfobacteriota bacterium]